MTSLVATVDRFNGFAQRGVDEDFRRGETPIQITFRGPVADDDHLPNGTMFPLADKPPCDATILAPGTDTKGGPRVSTPGPVMGADGGPVPGLYAVGNSTAAPTGQGYISGGMTFGPILTFGYLAAHAAVQEPGRQAAGLHATETIP